MISRVTNGVLVRELLGNVRRLEARLADAQADLSSGKRLRQPSDDPAGAARANHVRGEIRDLGALADTLSFATSVLGAQDAALEDADDILGRAREIAAQQASGLATPDSRLQAAEEVAELERALLSLPNAKVGGRHVFAGLATGAAPFAQLDDPGFDPLNPYSGTSEPFVVRTAADTTLRLTTPGDQVFGEAVVALDGLRTTLLAGSPPTSSIDALEDAAAGLRAERASVGARAARVEQRASEIKTLLEGAKERLGAVEDADAVAVITELTQLQTALQATLASSQVLQTSILDYLSL